MTPENMAPLYRSRREPLIASSKHHYYSNRLAAFPSVLDADSTTAVQFHFVQEGRWRSGSSGGVNPVEARETATLLFELLEQHPDQSLGVITFNLRQQFAVLDKITRLRSERPEMEEFFEEDRSEPLFFKNLENVQGDERDRIIISVGYGPDEQGRFAMRFGPLNVQGGARRLNVAVTRAKEQVILVSSIRASDIDLNRVQSVGARMLRAYLASRLALVKEVRQAIGDRALIICNANDRTTPQTASFINGYFMECYRSRTAEDWKRIADTLAWAENNLRSPRVNCLETWFHKSRDDLHLMRATTTLVLTHSNGYCLFSDPNPLPTPDHLHNSYSFWDKSLGKPVAEKAAANDGTVRREFNNGTVIYNPMGNKSVDVIFRQPRTSVATGRTAKEHHLASPDGDIYLLPKERR